MNTEENNKMIAEFMGHKIDWGFKKDCILYMPTGEGTATNNSMVIPLEKLKYNTSWAWLMPVLKKINLKLHPNTYGAWRMITHPIEYKIEDVHNQVVKFINQLKK